MEYGGGGRAVVGFLPLRQICRVVLHHRSARGGDRPQRTNVERPYPVHDILRAYGYLFHLPLYD